MKRNRMLAVLAVVAVVAVSLISYCWLATDDGPSVTQMASKYVSGWQDSGMYLPEQEECQFFARNFAETKAILVASLSHQMHEVRMRVAFVIDKIGNVAGSLSPAVIDSLSAEKARIGPHLPDQCRAFGGRKRCCGSESSARVVSSAN